MEIEFEEGPTGGDMAGEVKLRAAGPVGGARTKFASPLRYDGAVGGGAPFEYSRSRGPVGGESRRRGGERSRSRSIDLAR